MNPSEKNSKKTIITKEIDDLWAGDLLDMKKFSKENKGYMCILNIIDTFSKFVWAVPIKNKNGITVSKALKKLSKVQNHKTINHPTSYILVKAENLKIKISKPS